MQQHSIKPLMIRTILVMTVLSLPTMSPAQRRTSRERVGALADATGITVLMPLIAGAGIPRPRSLVRVRERQTAIGDFDCGD
jgi:hypothetical protein